MSHELNHLIVTHGENWTAEHRHHCEICQHIYALRSQENYWAPLGKATIQAMYEGRLP